MFKLASTSQRSLTVHGVCYNVCLCERAPDFLCRPPLSSSLHPFVNWPLCGGFIMPLDCFHNAPSFTWIKDTLTSLSTHRIIPTASINTFPILQFRQLMEDLQGCGYSAKPLLALWKCICTLLSCKQWKAHPCITTKMFGQMCTTGACTQPHAGFFHCISGRVWQSQNWLRLEYTENTNI